MKIGIITFHRAGNYGAVLQAYALQQAIQSRGEHCEIVDYRNSCIERTYRVLPFSGAGVKKLLSVLANFPVRAARKKTFSEFRKEYLKTGPVYTEQNIQMANKEYDGFLFGSDQVWNASISGGDLNYLGAFISLQNKRAAYAASFGETKIPEELTEQYIQELKKFRKLAVREKNGKDVINRLTGLTAQEVADPVFLRSADEWKQLCSGKKKKEKYIFVYQLQGVNTKIMKYAQYLSKKTGCRIVEFQAWAGIKKTNVKPVFSGSPTNFVKLICDAEYVVTDSFHCTAFSVIFEKAFWAGIDPKKSKEKTRVGNLLLEIGLQERILPETLTEWQYDAVPVFSDSRQRLKEIIASSNDYIDAVLKIFRQN